MWDRSVECTVGDRSSNFIDAHILRNNAPVWRLTGYYGYPERAQRINSWNLIKELKNKSALPWVLIGDFNDMVTESDKHGSHKHPQWLLDGFRNTVEDCGLNEVELTGGRFTWEKSRGTKDWVKERLDRAFASSTWWQLFPLCKLEVHHTIYSDHDPLQLDLVGISHSKKKFRFRFENTWLKEKSFHEEVSQYWSKIGPIHFLPKLLDLSSFMEKWGRRFFNKFREKIRKQKEILSFFEGCENEEQTRRYFEERSKLDDLMIHEEAYWKQRAKSFWLMEGDSNSKFFHAFASTRKKRSQVTQLINDDGEVVNDQEGMCHLVKKYFEQLFGQPGNSQVEENISSEVVISEEQNKRLVEEFTFEEFSIAVRQMHPDKSAGPDGLNPAFYQNFWSLLGKNVYQCCVQWLKDLSFPVNLNDTTVVLIPKKTHADSLKDLRPIALCNVLYKVLAKVLSNRLREILPSVIGECQSAFVPGRSITDNVLVAFEILHFMKQKKSGGVGEVALKLDVSKAYDRVNWGFLKKQMQQMGFSERWISWIMLCVSTVSYNVNFNGDQIGPILPKRGLRQGDPLSPYLFLLCVEGLSCALKKSAEEGRLSGCKISTTAPAVTHLLFADDSFLFCKANTEEVEELKQVLERYELHSGQAINFQKSGIYFSANVRLDKQQEIKHMVGVHNNLSEGRYLGLPSLIGRSKKQVFNFLKDRMWNKIQGWSEKCLSKAGKAVLLRNVAQAVPSYAMSCFLIPKSLCTELERMMNSFWWGSNEEGRRGIRWLSWSNMSMSKGKGGMGFRDLYGFNISLLGKHCWNFLSQPNTLVARIFKARYFSNTSLFDATRSGGCSYIWSGLWQAKEALKKGFKWVLGDGESIRVFGDPWLRGKEQFMADNTYTSSSSELRVCEMFLPGVKQWDESKVKNLLTVRDANIVMALPVPKNQVPDRIAWNFTNDGKYVVKSGYRFWHDHYSECTNVPASKGWVKLWQLTIPHKMRVFLWRICRNNIPVRNILKGKGVQTTIICPMCTNDIEHMLHVFLDCVFAKDCWKILDLDFNTVEVESCSEWLLTCLERKNNEEMVQIATVLWGIWTARNMKVWEEKVITPQVVMQSSMNQVFQWRDMQVGKASSNGSKGQRQHSSREHWKVPNKEFIKINVDASLFAGSSNYAVGMVSRDDRGQFYSARNMRREGEISVFEAEAVGVLEALKWGIDLGLQKVQVETDSMLTVQAIKNNRENLMEVGNVLQECRALLRNRQDFSISFVRKQANNVAHMIARVPCEVNCCNDFLSPPPLVLETILYEAYLN